MDLGSANTEDERSTDAALRAGLRRIPARRLSDGHGRWLDSRAKRLWWVTYCALTVDDWSCVAVDPRLVSRVGELLWVEDGDVALERVAHFVRRRRSADA